MKSLRITLLLLSVFLALAAAAPPKEISPDDERLNAVLPDNEVQSSRISDAEIIPVEATTKDVEVPTSRQTPTQLNDANYFSGLFTHIFQIPISVLQAVRDMLKAATGAKGAAAPPPPPQ